MSTLFRLTSSNSGDSELYSCSICLEELNDLKKEEVFVHERESTEQVWHAMHKECLKDWLLRWGTSSLCPLCKLPIDPSNLFSPLEKAELLFKKVAREVEVRARVPAAAAAAAAAAGVASGAIIMGLGGGVGTAAVAVVTGLGAGIGAGIGAFLGERLGARVGGRLGAELGTQLGAVGGTIVVGGLGGGLGARAMGKIALLGVGAIGAGALYSG